ncbi:response regulator [Aquibacillus rhizosphaerae]|uniref:Response regulator n=1 Tax=Aquibacillus rhizosphaerae TaxID=3051431 RepID=A0ABT7L650_9BACI|nr:response regulator [Aquibacillus sp. LR5S19]MDL4840682.1 response regulator [Aquibacillus sp. LR5S19]
MKKVFLVDDEKVIREGIGKSINWKKEGFEYCGDAPDGEIALPLIEKSKPDIVITDIKMPFMDGLQLSRILRDKLPDLKIIILSGHDEFEYAREAMRAQVSEYCLKPVTAFDLLEILHKVSDQIDIEEWEKKQLTDLKNQALENASLTKNHFLGELCEGSHSTASAIKKASELGIDLLSSYYYVLIIESELRESASINSIAANHSCLVFKRKSKETVFIMKSESKQQLESEIEQIRKQLLLEPDSISFGLGKIKNRIQAIAESFDEASKEKNFSSNITKKYNVNNTEVDIKSNKDIHQFNRNDLIHFLKFGEKSNITNFSQNYSSYLKSANIRTPFFIYYFLMDFTITVTHYIKEQDNGSVSVLNEISQLETQVSWIKDYEEIISYMEKMLHTVIEFREQVNSKFGVIIQKTKDYIHDHYHDHELSLQLVAKKVNVSASYLSHMFSQETGQTLIEYLTKTRIERAKEFLKTTNDKTYEIAHKVGYSDSHYFCHSFKKMTGMTTKEFKSHVDTPIS